MTRPFRVSATRAVALLLAFCAAGSARSDTVTLTSGEVLIGKVVAQTSTSVQLEHPLLGTLTIAADKVKAVAIVAPGQNPASAPATTEAGATVAALAATTQGGVPPLLTTGFLGNWKCALDIGVNGATGNSESVSGLLAFLAKKDRETYRLAVDSSYRYISSGGAESTNKATAGVAGDYDFADTRWFVFGDGRFEYDHFEPWEYRVSAHTGPGYNIFRNDVYKWNVRAGAGFFKEFHTTDERVDAEGVLGTEFSWQISKASSLETTAYLFPGIRDPQTDERSKETIVYAQKLDFLRGVKWKLGLEHDWDSRNPAPTKKSDFFYYTAISLEF
jgi:putative salt-induced outer membrane protein YdiY